MWMTWAAIAPTNRILATACVYGGLEPLPQSTTITDVVPSGSASRKAFVILCTWTTKSNFRLKRTENYKSAYPWPVPRINVPMGDEVNIPVRIDSDIFRVLRIVQIQFLRCETIVLREYWKVDVDFVGTFRIHADWSWICCPWICDGKTTVDAIAFRRFRIYIGRKQTKNQIFISTLNAPLGIINFVWAWTIFRHRHCVSTNSWDKACQIFFFLNVLGHETIWKDKDRSCSYFRCEYYHVHR